MVTFDSIESLAIIFKDNATCVAWMQTGYIGAISLYCLLEMFYSHESEEINTLQTKSSENFMRFIHKVPTNFHISQCVIEIGMR